jgi:hypothetical protein
MLIPASPRLQELRDLVSKWLIHQTALGWGKGQPWLEHYHNLRRFS